jgi:hypothetical protein
MNSHRATATMKTLEVYLDRYEKAGYLTKDDPEPDGKATTWTTTPKFHLAKFMLSVFRDIDQYVRDENITAEELEKLGYGVDMTIYQKKDFPNQPRSFSDVAGVLG